MQEPASINNLKKSIENLPVFIVLDSLYSRNDSSPISVSKAASQRYAELAAKLSDILQGTIGPEAIPEAREMPFTSLFSIAEMIVYSLAKARDIMLEVMFPNYPGDFLACHSLNVAFLSCKVGMGMGMSYRELTELTVGSLLHDIGMTRIDQNCYLHEGDLTKGERSIVENHPMLGYRLFEKLKSDFPWLLRIIMEEHRRENQSGYPENAGGELHQYSKIIGVCDSFEALTHSRSFRKAFHPADAMKNVISAKDTSYSKHTLRAMIESLSIYPVGSLVQLNNKKVAQVIDAVQGSPMRPIVQVIRDENNMQEREKIDLSSENNIYITGLVYDTDYQIPEKQ